MIPLGAAPLLASTLAVIPPGTLRVHANPSYAASLTTLEGKSNSSVSSWKPPWDARQDAFGALDSAGYDPVAIDSYFSQRPERACARTVQIVAEIGGILVALAKDRVASSIPARDRVANSAARHIREAVTRLGPNFVKIGQALASRPDLVGEAIAGELLLLQDALPPYPNDVASRFICEELGAPPEDCFAQISDEPVAAASLGQVYKAWVGERPVAVKVQRPDLLEAVGLDFYLARSAASAIMLLSRNSGFLGGKLAVQSDLVAAVDEYGSRLFEELDYRNEAQNMVRFRELYGSIPGVVVPRVLPAYSGQRVITSEWIDGSKLVDDQAQVDPADLPVLRVGIECTLTQLLDKGFLHADPHGGNLLKTPDDQLAYLDFGLVSTIPPGVMDALICATVHVMNRDYVALAKGFPALALMNEGDLAQDFEPFAQALRGALDPIVTDFRQQMGLDDDSRGSASSGSERVAFAQIIDRVFLLARSFSFSVPPYFISNVRALGELEGLAMTADPGFNMISVVYPYVCRRLLSDPSPPLRAALRDLALSEDGFVRWEVLEALMRDSSVLDGRLAAAGNTGSNRMDLSLEFLVSREGEFVRAAALSDVRRAATAMVKASLSGMCTQRRSTSRAAATSSAMQFEAPRDLREGEGRLAPARMVSRRKLRKRVLTSARRKPLLGARAVAVIAASAGRAGTLALLRALRRLLRRPRSRASSGPIPRADA